SARFDAVSFACCMAAEPRSCVLFFTSEAAWLTLEPRSLPLSWMEPGLFAIGSTPSFAAEGRFPGEGGGPTVGSQTPCASGKHSGTASGSTKREGQDSCQAGRGGVRHGSYRTHRTYKTYEAGHDARRPEMRRSLRRCAAAASHVRPHPLHDGRRPVGDD